MPQEIRLWEVAPKEAPVELTHSSVNLEEDLEGWLESDISMLDPDLLVIGRQVPTGLKTKIDLLCIDREGSLVVVELKKGLTPREVTAQALDYASWVKDLEVEQIEKIASEYGKSDGWLEDQFRERFDVELPETLNEDHRSLVVAESIDDSTERIVTYLADLGVHINVATVQHFKDRDGRELLAQVFLVEPEKAKETFRSKRRTAFGIGKLLEMAKDNDIGHLFERLRDRVRGVRVIPQRDAVLYVRKTHENKHLTMLKVYAHRSENGGMRFIAHATRFYEHLRIDLGALKSLLPTNARETTYVRGWGGSSDEEQATAVSLEGDFQTVEEVDKFVEGLRQAINSPTDDT